MQVPTNNIQILAHHTLWIWAQEDIEIQDAPSCSPCYGWTGLQYHIFKAMEIKDFHLYPTQLCCIINKSPLPALLFCQSYQLAATHLMHYF